MGRARARGKCDCDPSVFQRVFLRSSGIVDDEAENGHTCTQTTTDAPVCGSRNASRPQSPAGGSLVLLSTTITVPSCPFSSRIFWSHATHTRPTTESCLPENGNWTTTLYPYLWTHAPSPRHSSRIELFNHRCNPVSSRCSLLNLFLCRVLTLIWRKARAVQMHVWGVGWGLGVMYALGG